MKTTTEETTNPTLASLGLRCRISSKGIGSCDGDSQNMLAWLAWFWRKGRSEASAQCFDYYTGIGCGPELSEQELSRSFPLVANVPKHNRYNIKNKTLLAEVAFYAATKAKWTPDPLDILWAISRDGDAIEMTFEDWASELGYDVDSRKAEKTYRACQDNALRLRKILSADKIETIKNLDL